MDSLHGYVSDDKEAIPPLNDLGWSVDEVSWRDTSVDFSRYHLVVIRTTWDYHQDPDAFLAALQRIEQTGILLANESSLIRWNLSKSYLKDLQERGIPVVPTHWVNGLNPANLSDAFSAFGTPSLVAKPLIGANASDTMIVTSTNKLDALTLFKHRNCLLQPFLHSIQTEGEYSLFYFKGQFSHAILKVPRSGDFRVQEEHGGAISAFNPGPELRQAGDYVFQQIEGATLYARVDLVRGPNNDFLVMELELIEPSMYLRMDEQAPARFAKAIDEWYRERRP